MKTTVNVVIGVSGAGKSTYAVRLAEYNDSLLFQFGQFARRSRLMTGVYRSNNPHAPEHLDGMVGVMFQAMLDEAERSRKSLVVDGYPRSPSQLAQFRRLLENRGSNKYCVNFLRVNHLTRLNECSQRLCKRDTGIDEVVLSRKVLSSFNDLSDMVEVLTSMGFPDCKFIEVKTDPGGGELDVCEVDKFKVYCPSEKEVAFQPERKILAVVTACHGDEVPTGPARSGDAGLDLKYIGNGVTVGVGQQVWLETGIRVKVPAGCVGFVRPRSSAPKELEVIEGTIDSGFTGDLKVRVNNRSASDYWVKPGVRLAQLVVVPFIDPTVEVVDALPETERGTQGFGSTGV